MAASHSSVLLDLDGTIVDSKPGIQASTIAAVRALGHRPDDLDISRLIGPPLEEVMAEVLRGLGDDRVLEAVNAYREHYGSAGFRETTVYPGVEAALDELLALGVTLYVATSKRRLFAERILKHLALTERFRGVHGSEPGGALDRKAELIAHVVQEHGLKADHCLMVGDRRHDVEGARANHIPAVGVLWGYGERDELETAGANYLAEDPADLIPIAIARGEQGSAS